MRIQDIRHRRQELQAQLFKLLDLHCSRGANIVRELSTLADEEDQILDHHYPIFNSFSHGLPALKH
ncbi:MAG: hypothetical protein WCE63_10895 [Acidobacteriaceae bacterium]